MGVVLALAVEWPKYLPPQRNPMEQLSPACPECRSNAEFILIGVLLLLVIVPVLLGWRYAAGQRDDTVGRRRRRDDWPEV